METDTRANNIEPPRWTVLLGSKIFDGRTTNDTRKLQPSNLPVNQDGINHIVQDLLRLGYHDVLDALFDEPPFPLNRLSMPGASRAWGDGSETAWTVLLKRLLCNQASEQPVELELGPCQFSERSIREFVDCVASAGPPLSLKLTLSEAGEHDDRMFDAFRESEKLQSLSIRFRSLRNIPPSFSSFISDAPGLSSLTLCAPASGLPAHLSNGLSTNRTIETLSLNCSSHSGFDDVLLALRTHPRIRCLQLGHELSPAETNSLSSLLSSAPQLTELVLTQSMQPGCVIPAGSLARLKRLDIHAPVPIEFMQAVLAGLCQPNVLGSLLWWHAAVTPTSEALLAQWLSTTTTLKELKFLFTSPESVQPIVDAVAGNRTLERFALDNVVDANWPDFSIEKLTQCESLGALFISASDLTAGACRQIAFLMGNHPSLVLLGLAGCRLQPGGFDAIALQLAGPSRIRQLDVTGSLSMDQFRTLLRSLSSNKSLRSLHAGCTAPGQALITAEEVEQWLTGNSLLVKVSATTLELFDPDAQQCLQQILTRNMNVYPIEGIAHLRQSLRGFMSRQTGIAETGDALWNSFVDKLQMDDEHVFSSKEALRSLRAMNVVTLGSNEIFHVDPQTVKTPPTGDNGEPSGEPHKK